MTGETGLPIVVVGASAAGVAAVAALRAGGWNGSIEVFGDEGALPYARPPLSKACLASGIAPPLLPQARVAGIANWNLDVPIVRANLRDRQLETRSGQLVSFEGLIIATGSRSVRLSVPGPRRGVFEFRSSNDLHLMRSALGSAVSVVIVGSGFIGCEIASSLAELGVPSTMVSPESPMARVIGAQASEHLHSLLVDQGVRFFGGRQVVAYEGDTAVTAVRLDDGSRVDADLVIEAVGTRPNVEWLQGNGLGLAHGVLCDDMLGVVGAPATVAAGDIVALAGGNRDVPRRCEFWDNALTSGRFAAGTLLHRIGVSSDATDGVSAQFTQKRHFTSRMLGLTVHGIGEPIGDLVHVRVDEAKRQERAYIFADGGIVTGVVVFGLQRELPRYRSMLGSSVETVVTSVALRS